MEVSGKKPALVETLVLSAGAVVFFELSSFIVIFVIPLAILFKRRGFSAGLGGCMLAAAAITAIKLYQMRAAPRYDFLGLAVCVPLSFLIGLAVLEAPRFARLRTWQRIVYASLAGSSVYLPLLYLLVTGDSEIIAVLYAQVETTMSALRGSGNPGILVPSVEEIVNLSRRVFLNTFLPVYFFTLAANWVIGVKMAMRLSGKTGEFPAYRSFRMPEKAVYVFLVSWALVFMSLFRDLGVVSIAAWNCALLVSILYMCQGVGIIKVRMESVPRPVRLIAALMCVVMAFTMGVIAVLGCMAGVSLLGVSELWINYRNKTRS